MYNYIYIYTCIYCFIVEREFVYWVGLLKTIDFQLKTFRKVPILYPGSLGTVSGRFWGPRGEKIDNVNIGSVRNYR